VRALLGKQAVAYGKGGVVGSVGSAADVRMDTAIRGERDVLIAEYLGEREVSAIRAGAASARRQGYFNTATSLMDGFTNVAGIMM